MNKQNMDDLRYVRPDYEAECKRLTDENQRLRDLVEQLKAKLADVECNWKDTEVEFKRMRAQLDMVYLIFGNRG